MWIMESWVTVVLLAFSLSSRSASLPSQRQARLTLAEPIPSYYHSNIDGHPGTYSFGYDVHDPSTGNIQYRSEERYPNGTVVGSYGYVDSRGRPQRYRYVADWRGYRVMSDLPRPVVSRPATLIATGDASVTWSRPRRPSKNDPSKRYLTKLPINKGNIINRNELLPPSYYASYK